MQTIKIPSTDLDVSAICLGTGNLGSHVDNRNSLHIYDEYVGHGGNFLDTANIYAAWLPGGKGLSEQSIGTWMKARKNRHHIVIATKGGHPHLSSMHISRLSASEITEDLEQSLGDLATDYIDLYYLHRDDPRVPVKDILEALEAKVKEGKIRYYACSNWHYTRIQEAVNIAKHNGYHGFVANQLYWSLAQSNDYESTESGRQYMREDELKFHCESQLAVMAYTSQANGLFTKWHNLGFDGLSANLKETYENERNAARFAALRTLSKQINESISTLVLAYIRSQRDFLAIPIIASSHVSQLRDSIAHHELVLDEQQLRFLEAEHVL